MIDDSNKQWIEQIAFAWNCISSNDDEKGDFKKKEAVVNKKNPHSFEKPILPIKLASNWKWEYFKRNSISESPE